MKWFSKRSFTILACAGFCLSLLASDASSESFWQSLKKIFSGKSREASAVSAENITIEKRTGKIEVITPDGKKKVYEASDKLLSIPVGSTIKVITGELVIECGGYKASLEKGEGVKVVITSAGNLRFKATSGIVTITTPEGKTHETGTKDYGYIAEPETDAPSTPEDDEVPDATEDPPASPSTP